MSSIDTKLDAYGRTLNSHLHHVHKKIAFQLEQLEYRFLQRIDILSGTAAEVHGQNNLRVTELYDSITPNELLQTGDLSTVQSVDSNADFAVSSSGTLNIGPVDFPFENQQADIANQTKKDIEILDSLLPGFRDAIRQWEVVAYANGADDSENIAVESSSSTFSNVINQLKEVEERQATKRHKRLGGIFEKINDFNQGAMLLDPMGISTVAYAGMGLIFEVG